MPVLRLPDPWEGCALWRLDLGESPATAGLASLDARERERAARFVFETDRRRYLAAHVALRTLLAQAAGLADAAAVRFTTNRFGKPLFENLPACHFSLSHSADVGLLAIDHRTPVGVDVEVPRPMDELDALARGQFTAAEYQAFAALPADQRLAPFLRTWTRKEACLKAIGTGLALDTRNIDTGIDAGPRELQLHHAEHGHHRLRLVSGALEAGILYSVAALRPAAPGAALPGAVHAHESLPA